MILAATGPDLGAGSSVAGGGRVVDADEQTRLLTSVGSRELDGVGGSGGAGTGDLDLGATNVELSTALSTGGVETDVLGTHEIAAGGELLGEGKGEVVDTLVVDVAGPLETPIGDGAGGQLVDLEPVTITEVVGGVGAGGGLAHVDSEGTGVAKVVVDSETDLVTSVDGVSLGSRSDVGIEATSVADNVLGSDILNGRVGIGGSADILVGLGDIAVDDESLKVVVGEDGGDGGRKGQDVRERSAHDDCCLGGSIVKMGV